MSVLCCRIPDFLIHLAARDLPHAAARPLAMLGRMRLVDKAGESRFLNPLPASSPF